MKKDIDNAGRFEEVTGSFAENNVTGSSIEKGRDHRFEAPKDGTRSQLLPKIG